jgi:hypothetical protein
LFLLITTMQSCDGWQKLFGNKLFNFVCNRMYSFENVLLYDIQCFK